MTTAAPLGASQEVNLPQGTLRYVDQGTGPTLVFIHGLLVNSWLWGRVIPLLAPHFRCLAPDLPLGAHSYPLQAGADLSPLAVARLVGDFLDALDLHEVTLVGNDTGGAICQLVIANHPERITRLVLTNCDAFEQFPPLSISLFVYGPRLFGIGFANFLAWTLRSRRVQRAFLAALAHHRATNAELDAIFNPLLQLPFVKGDMTRFLRAVSSRDTLKAAQTFARFRHPVMLLWGKDDLFFPIGLARRLQHAFPQATLEVLTNSRAFVPLDQPEILAQRITELSKSCP